MSTGKFAGNISGAAFLDFFEDAQQNHRILNHLLTQLGGLVAVAGVAGQYGSLAQFMDLGVRGYDIFETCNMTAAFSAGLVIPLAEIAVVVVGQGGGINFGGAVQVGLDGELFSRFLATLIIAQLKIVGGGIDIAEGIKGGIDV